MAPFFLLRPLRCPLKRCLTSKHLQGLAKRWRPAVYSAFKRRQMHTRPATCTNRLTNWNTTGTIFWSDFLVF